MQIQRFALLILIALQVTCGYCQNKESDGIIKVTVHPGVELVTIILNLSGRYMDTPPSKYMTEMHNYFDQYKNLQAVIDLKEIKKDQIAPDLSEIGFCFSDYPDFKLHITDSTVWDKYYGRDTIKRFLENCALFAKTSNYLTFYKEHKNDFESWGESIRNGYKKDSIEIKLHDFFNTSNNIPNFYICLDPQNKWFYHAIVTPEEYNPVYKNWKAYTYSNDNPKPDSAGNPKFIYSKNSNSFMWHEGSHIYLEPIFRKYKNLVAALSYLYNKDDDGMIKQNINSWEYCLNENITRAIVIALTKKYFTATGI